MSPDFQTEQKKKDDEQQWIFYFNKMVERNKQKKNIRKMDISKDDEEQFK